MTSQVELLEDRTLLSVGSAFYPATGTLLIVTDTSDDVAVTAGTGGEVLINGASPQTGTLLASDVLAIELSGGQGSNELDLSGVTAADFSSLTNPAAIEVYGGDGADVITASPIGGLYFGEHGDDVIDGGAGNDTIDGDDGHDTINGAAGDDYLIGEDGDDVIDGGTGNDTIAGGDGTDSVDGGLGDDDITGGDNSDTLNGNAGADTLNGGYSDDVLSGGDDNDVLFGGSGKDTLNGDDGDDHLNGQGGDDALVGGTGDDTVKGASGADSILGGNDQDLLRGGAGPDTLDGGAGDDTLNGDADDDSLLGGNGNDCVLGGAGQDDIFGGADDDVLLGQGGNDTLAGGGGADTLDGGTGDDLIESAGPPQPAIAVSDATITEGNTGTTNLVVTVSLSEASNNTVTVDFATAASTATAGSDYQDTNGTLTFTPGVTDLTVTVPILGDALNELDETFFINLSNENNATLAVNRATVTILNDDAVPTLAINDVTQAEGNAGTSNANFTVTLSAPSGLTVTVDYATADGTATSPADYQTTAGTLTFAPGTTTQTISVPVVGETLIETTESFSVNLSNPANATIADGQGQGTIPDDGDTDVGVTIDDVTVNEGDSGTTNATFTVTLSQAATADVSVDWATADGTATAADNDYNAANNTLTITAGNTSGTFNVQVVGDTNVEGNENFFVNLSNAVGGFIVDGQGIGTIVDEAGGITATDKMVFGRDWEPSHGDTGSILPAVAYQLSFGTGDGSLSVGVDGFGAWGGAVGADSSRATYDPFGPQGPRSHGFENGMAIRIGTSGPREFLTSGSIQSSGGLTNPTVTGTADTANSTFSYGGLDFSLVQTVGPLTDAGSTVIGAVLTQTYTVTNPGTSTVDFETVSLRHNDFGSGGGRIVCAAGSEILFELEQNGATETTPTGFIGLIAEGGTTLTSNRYEIDAWSTFGDEIVQGRDLDDSIRGDLDGDGFIDAGGFYDVNPALRNVFSLAPGASDTYTVRTLFGDGAVGDFCAPVVTSVLAIDDVTVPFEGDTGTTDATFTVTLTPASTDVVTVNYNTGGGSATAGQDYQTTTGTLTFAPGQTSQTITVPVFGDTIQEPDETFRVRLTGATNANIVDDRGIATIVDDDAPLDAEGDLLRGSDGGDTIVGADGNDTIDGGSGDDSIQAGGGDDIVNGAAGKDTIEGGDGNDLLNGGRNSDTLRGEAGNDTITWETGDGFDAVDGGLGFDELQVRTLQHNDRITVAADDARFTVHHRIPSDAVGETISSGMIEVLAIDSDRGADKITIEDLTGVQDLQLIEIDAGRGSDLVDASEQANPAILVSVNGGGGPDTVLGGNGNDAIDGGDANDSLSGGGGDDTINGSGGVDQLFGGDGNDFLSGGDGRDFIRGENGDDTLDGGLQNDDLYGGAGNDLMLGGPGDDSALGEAGDDVIDGGDGDDTLRGGSGNDTLSGQAGVDSLAGDDDDDTLQGGADGDTLVGGAGNDLLQGGEGTVALLDDGNDFLNGNAGEDTLQGERGEDTLLGGSGRDDLDGGFGNDQLNGNAGDDSMLGGHGDDLMRGAAGDDTLNGGHGEDTMRGELGDDALAGDDGHDRMNGGAGNDTLHGGDGDDTLRGGADQDLLIGHDGNDDLDGQGGSPDTLVGSDAFDVLNDNAGSDLVDNAFEFVADWIDVA